MPRTNTQPSCPQVKMKLSSGVTTRAVTGPEWTGSSKHGRVSCGRGQSYTRTLGCDEAHRTRSCVENTVFGEDASWIRRAMALFRRLTVRRRNNSIQASFFLSYATLSPSIRNHVWCRWEGGISTGPTHVFNSAEESGKSFTQTFERPDVVRY